MSPSRRHADAGVIRPRKTSTEPPRQRGTTFARLVGGIGMVGLTLALFWLLTDDSFRITEASVRFEGLEHADEAAVRAHLSGIDRAPNVFRVRAADIVSDVSVLPDVDAATAAVTLPATISVNLQEREPLFVWSDSEIAWMVDEEGMLFGPTGFSEPSGEEVADAGGTDAVAGTMEGDEADPSPAATVGPASIAVDRDATELPVVIDARLPAAPPTVGSHLPQEDLMVMRHLLAITPEMLSERAGSLQLRVDENKGYVLHSDRGWSAIFGHYTPRVQPIESIPRQVQCLQAVLAAEERRLAQVWLSLSETGCGTFTTRQ
jgi:hypothetical protein